MFGYCKGEKAIDVDGCTGTVRKWFEVVLFNLILSWQTLRPTLVDLESDLDRPIVDVADNVSPWTVFLEMANPETPDAGLPTFDKDSDVMLFFKYYDPSKEKIYYMGHMYVSITSKVSSMIPELARRANLPGKSSMIRT